MQLDELEGDRCPICSTELPDDARGNKIYCSIKCQRRARVLREIEKRREVRAAFTCANCGKHLTEAKSATAIYCSKACRWDAGERARKVAAERAKREVVRAERIEGRTCDWCAGPIADEKQAGITHFCSAACRDRARYARKTKEARSAVRLCKACGDPIDPSKPLQTRHCSTRCRQGRPKYQRQ